MTREPSVDHIIEAIRDEDAQRNINELIKARKDDRDTLSRYNQSPQKLSSRLRQYVDGEGTVFLLDDEEREMSFKAYGFICGMSLPLNMLEMAKRDRFKPGIIRQQVSIIGGGSELFAEFIAAQRSLYSFMAISTGREPFRSFMPEYFSGIECLSPATRLFTRQTSGDDVVAIDLPDAVDYTGRVRDVCRRKGYIFTEDNMVHYGKLIPSITTSGFDVVDVPLSYLTVGQLVEIKISFRGYKIGHSYSFRGKLNSVVVYNDDVSRNINEIVYNEDRTRQEASSSKTGVPNKRKRVESSPERYSNIPFLKNTNHVERATTNFIRIADPFVAGSEDAALIFDSFDL